MKIIIDHHSPFILAHGGFQIQIEQTFHALKSLGVDIDWLHWWDDKQHADIIHFFGKVHAGYLRFARDKGIRTVISELHTGLGSHPGWKRAIQRQVIGLAKSYLRPLAGRMNWDNYELANAIVALTPFEADLMSNVFHAPRERILVIPTGVDDVFLEPNTIPRGDWLLCTAVIHPRKRVLELAQAAILANTPLRVYGRPYSKSDAYFRAFLDVVTSSGGLVCWEGSLDNRAALADAYRRARGFVLLSTMESLSLSALEAAATGTPLLLSDLPWANSTFHSCATYVPNTGKPADIASHLKRFFLNPRPPVGFRAKSWRDIASQLKLLYESVLSC
jgi:glycosyltransferase involved in cell wall biosynthesis